MTVFQALVLGITQGITEFIPVSSSGHLILIPYIFGWKLQSLSFDVALHFGTTLAVLVFFWRDWYEMIRTTFEDVTKGLKQKKISAKTLRPEARLFCIIIAVTIPVALIAFLLEDTVKTYFRTPTLVAFMLILVSGIMWIADRYSDRHEDKVKIKELPFFSALLVSLSQVLALLPGTSRSGISISAGLFKDLTRESAAKLSFLLATPLIVGATILQVPDLLSSQDVSGEVLLVGFVTSFIVGALAIALLLKYLRNHKLTLFIVYRIILGILILILAL